MQRENAAPRPTMSADLEESDVVHRYLQIEERSGFEQVDSKNDWFILDGQETWLGSRPISARSWETSHRS